VVPPADHVHTTSTTVVDVLSLIGRWLFVECFLSEREVLRRSPPLPDLRRQTRIEEKLLLRGR
jgi:hypothetical protein